MSGDGSSKKWLLFTSAGDRSNIKLWLGKEKKYDVFVVYYGETTLEFEPRCDYFYRRKGGKYQNLHHFFFDMREFFDKYEAVLVMDDDIVISTEDINKLFDLREERNLDLLQPSFDRRGKISHKITEFNPLSDIRFTNFVEVTCPLFSQRALSLFLNHYNPVINATGADWWYCHLIEDNFGLNTIAISDRITCLNPHDLDKDNTGKREIDLLVSRDKRNKTWKELKANLNLVLEEDVFKTYKKEGYISLRKVSFWFYTKILNLVLRIYRKLH